MRFNMSKLSPFDFFLSKYLQKLLLESNLRSTIVIIPKIRKFFQSFTISKSLIKLKLNSFYSEKQRDSKFFQSKLKNSSSF